MIIPGKQLVAKFYAYVPDEQGNEPTAPDASNTASYPWRRYFSVRGINPHLKAKKRAKVYLGEDCIVMRYYDIRDRKTYYEI